MCKQRTGNGAVGLRRASMSSSYPVWELGSIGWMSHQESRVIKNDFSKFAIASSRNNAIVHNGIC